MHRCKKNVAAQEKNTTTPTTLIHELKIKYSLKIYQSRLCQQVWNLYIIQMISFF